VRTSLRNLLAAASVAALAACVPLPPPGAVFISARFGPPPPRVEVIGVAPAPEFVWIRGFWSWDGMAYAWMPGHWERRPYARAVWVPDRWRHHAQGWYREEGHWKGAERGQERRERNDR
jgi:hypothetical protein